MQTDRFQEDISKKFNLNEAINSVSSAIGSALKKPDTHITYNTIKDDEEEKDNTMLYVGIGGAALLVILLIVFMKK